MNKNEKFHDSMPSELTDDELDCVAGGISSEDLEAWWSRGYQGVPLCPQHGGRKVYMKSYWYGLEVHLECTECGYIRVI